jgi:heptosyltransferase-1
MEKILIVRLGALGDILHALPAVTAIRMAMPQATIGWVVEARWSELLTAPGHKMLSDAIGPQKPVVNVLHTVDTMRWRKNALSPSTMREIRGDLGRIRKTGYEFALDFQGNIKSAFLARLSSASTVAGYTDPREYAARFFYNKKFVRSGEHVIEQNHAMAAAAVKGSLNPEQFKLAPPKLPCDPASEAWAQSEIARLGIAGFVIMNPGAGWGGKQWPAERFGEVARALAVHNLKTLVNAGPGEEDLARQVLDASAGHSFAVTCTISQLIAITRHARLFIGGDTGPLHLAAALNVPVVGLFGPTDPLRTGPFGVRNVVLRHPESKTTFSHHRSPDEGLMQISAGEVVAAARHLLGRLNG